MSASNADDGDGVDVDTGRRKHLGELALVFKHRHGTWRQFGLFLENLFQEGSVYGKGIHSHKDCMCRHAPGGKHYAFLRAAAAEPDKYPVLMTPHYHQPCFSIGSWDKAKNPGFVVHDLCVRAHKFLEEVQGLGPGQLERDFDYDPEEHEQSQSTVGGASVDPDSQGAIDRANIVIGGRDRQGRRASSQEVSESGHLPVPEDGTHWDGDDMFEDQDVLEDLDAMLSAAQLYTQPRPSAVPEHVSHLVSYPTSMETPTGYAQSTDSRLASSTRSSTKLRVATLAYLCQYSRKPEELREAFRRLRNDKKAHVLHLCGCGICYERNGIRYPGCCEPSHLMLGSFTENKLQESCHVTINISLDVSTYESLIGLWRKNKDYPCTHNVF